MMFLRSVGEAMVAQGMRGLMGHGPFGESISDVASAAIERYRREGKESTIAWDVEQVIQAEIGQIQDAAREIARELAGGCSEEEIGQLEAWLTQLPSVARQSLKRPADPKGKTIPDTLNLTNPYQLTFLLPRRAPRFRIGATVPHAPQWRFQELLGAGGFGEVWLARHTFMDQLRAFKFCLDSGIRDRLLRHEGEVVKRVMSASAFIRDTEHGIVPLVDACLEGDAPWLAYEFIDGGDLMSVAGELIHRPPVERGVIILQLLADLAAVIGRFHLLSKPIIHRDLKPANVLVRKMGDTWLLRVTDFGVSHIGPDRGLRDGTVSGPPLNLLGDTFRAAHTPLYASTQQKKGLAADVRDDVHALGIIGYQLLLGDLSVERPAGKWRKKLIECQIADGILDLLENCWDDDPGERPENAAVLSERLLAWLQPGPGSVWADIDEDYQSYLDWFRSTSRTRGWLEQHSTRISRWQTAAAQNVGKAMVLLGDCCEEGIGVPRDYVEAMKWYRKAAELGNNLAMNNIGLLFDNGLGVTKDYPEAMKWYVRAAEAGNNVAMKHIGLMFQYGRGVPASRPLAREWYQKAIAAGNEEAKKLLKNLGG